MKRCSLCSEEKEIEDFYKRKDAKDGLKSYCIQCAKEQKKSYKLINGEKIKKSRKKWLLANPKKRSELRKRRTSTLQDTYIKSSLNLPKGVIAPPELIELKRISIQIKRQIKATK